MDKNPDGRNNTFYGYSIAMRALGGEHFALSPRFDWYKDRDGFITTVPQTMREFTITADWKWAEGSSAASNIVATGQTSRSMIAATKQ